MGKRELGILGTALALAVLGAVFFFREQTLATGSWGLHFRQAGSAPVGNAEQSRLKQYDAAYLGDTGQKVLYLTFDAGYENGFTAGILDTLKTHQVPAAFFLVGHYLQKNPDLVRRMVTEGHTVGNHTMHHRDMSRLTDPAAFSRELTDLEELYRQVTGQELPKFYRPPQGIYSEENLKLARQLGYRTVFWSLAYADWDPAAQPEPAAALEKLQSRTHDGAVVLLHSTSRTNAAILDDLLTGWKAQGYRFGSLEELFQEK